MTERPVTLILCGGKQPPPCRHDLSRMDPWWRERHDCASQDAFDAEQARLRAALSRTATEAETSPEETA